MLTALLMLSLVQEVDQHFSSFFAFHTKSFQMPKHMKNRAVAINTTEKA